MERPAYPCVAAGQFRFTIVLDKCTEIEVGREIEPRTHAHDFLCEVALRQAADITFQSQIGREQGQRSPGSREVQLMQCAFVKATEPPGELSAEPAFRRQL